jgi:hypothetical protein
MVDYIENENFYCNTKIVYPPFKNGLYMEEFFLDYVSKNNIKYDKNGRLYIPCLWTNFQTESWFRERKNYMQQVLDNWVLDHPNKPGYFTVVQHDDGPMLQLPPGTLIYGACNGQIPLPLIYQDIDNRLASVNKKTFKNKQILCSFVGSATHNVRNNLINQYKNDYRFKFSIRDGWTNQVQQDHQNLFVDMTVNSKFALAPRGYGKSSFRFFECFLLGTIPVYVWDDKEWLPYQDILDYDKFSISIHESEIDILDEILTNVNEKKYNSMLVEYEKVKHMFGLDFMCEFICGNREPSLNNLIKIENIIKPKSRVLLVAISIGDRYLRQYNHLFRKSHEIYAKKHGYDFQVLDNYIEPSYKYNKMSIYYQKFMVCNCLSKDVENPEEYDFIIYVDSDIFINPGSPSLHDFYDFKHQIGIADEYSQPTPEVRIQIQKQMGWETSAKDYYNLCDFELDTKQVLNSGVLVIQPKLHKGFLENLYYEHLPNSMVHKRGPHYEQTSLGYELQTQNLCKIISNKWNAIWSLHKMCGANLDDFFKDNYFIHFAGNVDFDKVLDLYKYL